MIMMNTVFASFICLMVVLLMAAECLLLAGLPPMLAAILLPMDAAASSAVAAAAVLRCSSPYSKYRHASTQSTGYPLPDDDGDDNADDDDGHDDARAYPLNTVGHADSSPSADICLQHLQLSIVLHNPTLRHPSLRES